MSSDHHFGLKISFFGLKNENFGHIFGFFAFLAEIMQKVYEKQVLVKSGGIREIRPEIGRAGDLENIGSLR